MVSDFDGKGGARFEFFDKGKHARKELRGGKGWEFIKDYPFQNAKAKVAFAPVRVWEKDGKAGVALEATMLVLQEGSVRTKMEDCFSMDTL